MLTRKRIRELLYYNPCTGEFYWRNVGMIRPGKKAPGRKAGCPRHDGYILIGIDKYIYLAHRIAWIYVYGEWPKVIDHIDRNPANNCIFNLRNVSQVENILNSRRAKDNRPQLNMTEKVHG